MFPEPTMAASNFALMAGASVRSVEQGGDRAELVECGGDAVAGLHRNSGGEGAGEDDVAGGELHAAGGERVGQPGGGVQRRTHDRGPGPRMLDPAVAPKDATQ